MTEAKHKPMALFSDDHPSTNTTLSLPFVEETFLEVPTQARWLFLVADFKSFTAILNVERFLQPILTLLLSFPSLETFIICEKKTNPGPLGTAHVVFAISTWQTN